MDNGFILIHRKLLEWEWYKNKNDRLVWFHCLLKANWKDGMYKGAVIPRGSFATSIGNLAKEVQLTIQQTRTSLNHLQLTNEITYQTNHHLSIITINKYDDYQLDNKQINKQITNKQQTEINTSNNNRININEEINNKEKDIYKYISKKKVFSKPTLQEIINYCNERNNNVDANRFYDFYESKDWMVGKNKMKDWKACVRTWEQRNKETTPSWFGKEIKERERTEDEERELQELIRGY